MAIDGATDTTIVDPTNSSIFSGIDPLSSVSNFLNELAAIHTGHHNTGHDHGAIGYEHEHMSHTGMHHGNSDEQQIPSEHDHTVDAAAGMLHGNDDYQHYHEHGNGQHSMQMWYHSGYREIILFKFWQIDSLVGLLLSCLLIFIMACLYEGIKWYRVYLQLSSARCPPSCGRQAQVENADDKCTGCRSAATVPLTNSTATKSRNKQLSLTIRTLQAVLYLVQLTLAYWLMLIAMTYNVWLTVAVITGAAFGHWLFAILKYFSPLDDQLDSLATDACH